jgi:hypothetical protein
MLTWLFKALTDAVYLMPVQVSRFLAKHPDETVLAVGAAKAIRTPVPEPVQASPVWITSRRAALIATSTALHCGDWVIPWATVSHAHLLRIRSLGAKALVLRIETSDQGQFQFGLQYDKAWETALPIAVHIEDGKIQRSALNVIARVILFAWIIYWVVSRFID